MSAAALLAIGNFRLRQLSVLTIVIAVIGCGSTTSNASSPDPQRGTVDIRLSPASGAGPTFHLIRLFRGFDSGAAGDFADCQYGADGATFQLDGQGDRGEHLKFRAVLRDYHGPGSYVGLAAEHLDHLADLSGQDSSGVSIGHWTFGYGWLSGPNPNLGFSVALSSKSSGRVDITLEPAYGIAKGAIYGARGSFTCPLNP